MKNFYFLLFAIIFSLNPIYAQIEDDLLPFDAVNYSKRDNWHIAVFLIDFTDIPSNFRAKFPDKNSWEQIIFQGNIATWFQDMSYSTTTLTGDVYDYTTSSEIFFDDSDNSVIPFSQILGSIDITAPGFDINNYDFLVFISCHDAAVQQSITTDKTFTINGTDYTQPVVSVSYRNGVFHRNVAQFPESDQLTEAVQYFTPTGTDTATEGDVSYDMKEFETVLLHELGHSLGLDNHANTSTNGNKSAHETPEVPNNGSFLNEEYGNKFDLMGDRQYGIGMNGAIRDVCGLIDPEIIYSKNWWGKTTVTVGTASSTTGKRFIEVLLPDERDFSGYKNHGYGLEVKTADTYNTMLTNPELSNNLNGFFVHKITGTEQLLLDMSPSSNIDYFSDYFADIRDVVLKPGMTYENDDVLFENVVDNGNGTWSVDITIKPTLIVTPEPTFTSATRLANGDIKIDWLNNCTDCDSGQLFIINYRKVGNSFWSSINDADLDSGTYTKTSLSDTEDYEFRGGISVITSTTHYDSLYSNSVSTAGLGIGDVSETVPKIYPNPSTDIVNIDKENIDNVIIYNAIGKKVFEKANSKRIDVQTLKSGIYFLKIASQGKTYYQKLIKK